MNCWGGGTAQIVSSEVVDGPLRLKLTIFTTVRMADIASQELPSMTTPSQSIEIYCFKCKAKTGSKDVEAITMKNDRPATRSTCVYCGTRKFRTGRLS